MDADTSSCLLSFLRRRYYKKKKNNNIYNIETGTIITQIIDDPEDAQTYVKHDKYRLSVNEEQLKLNIPEIVDYKRAKRRRPSLLERSLSKNNQPHNPPQFINDLEETSKKIESSFSKCTIVAPEVDYENIREAVIPILKVTEGLTPLPKRKEKRDLERKDTFSNTTDLNDEEYEHIKLALKMMFSNVDKQIHDEIRIPLIVTSKENTNYARRVSKCEAKLTSLVEDVLKSKSVNRELIEDAICVLSESSVDTSFEENPQWQDETVSEAASNLSNNYNKELREYEQKMKKRSTKKLVNDELQVQHNNESNDELYFDEPGDCQLMSGYVNRPGSNENTDNDEVQIQELQTKMQLLYLPENEGFHDLIPNKQCTVRRSSTPSTGNIYSGSMMKSGALHEQIRTSPKLNTSGRHMSNPLNRLCSFSHISSSNAKIEHCSSFVPYKKSSCWAQPEPSTHAVTSNLELPTSSNESVCSDDSTLRNLSMIHKSNLPSQFIHSSSKSNQGVIDARKIVNKNSKPMIIRRISGDSDCSSTSTPTGPSKNENHTQDPVTNAYGQVIIEPDGNLSDKEVYPDLPYKGMRMRASPVDINCSKEEHMMSTHKLGSKKSSVRSRAYEPPRSNRARRNYQRSKLTNERTRERPKHNRMVNTRSNTRSNRGNNQRVVRPQTLLEADGRPSMKKRVDRKELIIKNQAASKPSDFTYQDGKNLIAIHDSSPQGEIQFSSGQIVHVKGGPDDQGFCLVEVDGVQGLVPLKYLREMPDVAEQQLPSLMDTKSLNRNQGRPIDSNGDGNENISKDTSTVHNSDALQTITNSDREAPKLSNEELEPSVSPGVVDKPSDNIFSMGKEFLFMKFGFKKCQRNDN